MIRIPWLVSVAAVAAAAVPLLPARQSPAPAAANWPAAIDGRKLTPLAPAPEDARLAAGFPGRIARFSDGRRQIVLRSVAGATRQLHPARDCFQAIGYAIAPLPMQRSPGGALASCVAATRDGRTLRICERITDAEGRSFADVSSWYWPALFGRSTGPWLAMTSVERTG